MSTEASVILATLLLEHDRLLPEELPYDLRLDARAFDDGHAHRCVALAITDDQEHAIENDRGTDVAVDLLDANQIPFANTMLLSACYHDRIHEAFLSLVCASELREVGPLGLIAE